MKRQSGRRSLLTDSRWLAYAAASAATTLGAAKSAEAEIHYSGPLNIKFNSRGDIGHQTTEKHFLLSDGVSIGLLQFATSSHYFDWASFAIVGAAASNKVRGYVTGSFFDYASKLPPGDTISQGDFITPDRQFIGLAYLYSFGQFISRGPGFIGFRFNRGGGMQYGWVRVKMSGQPRNAFLLVDYAWGDVGDTIVAGQKASAEQAPDKGSLGWLAIGAVGLLAWRKSRSRTAPLKNA